MGSTTRATTREGPGALAIATFTLGLLGIVTGGLTALVALVTGILEFINIRAGRSSRAGYVLNLVGFAVACLTLVLVVAVGVAVINLFRPLLDEIQKITSSARP